MCRCSSRTSRAFGGGGGAGGGVWATRTGTAMAVPVLVAQTPPPAPPPPPKARDVREEQRHIADYLTYAASDLQKGLERAGANNLDLATVSGLHAVDQMLQCSKLMDKDPYHVEQVRSWFFDNDAATKRHIEREIDQVVTEVSRQAAAKVGGGSDASTGLHAGWGGPEAGALGAPGSSENAQSLGNGITAVAGKGGVILSDPSGRSATLAGATLNPDGTARLADGRTVDLKNAAIEPDGRVRLASGETLNGSGGDGGVANANSRFVGTDGGEIVIPADFDWKNGIATGIEKVFVGGRGGRLIRETKVTFRPNPSPGQPNTFVVARENGEVRSWAFDVQTVPGTEKKSTGSLTIAFELTDRNGATGFTIEKWDISGPGGSPAVSNSAGAQATATFAASGEYTIQVSGKTDWGSAFTIKKTLPVGVE